MKYPQLVNGVVLSAQYPETYKIPSEIEKYEIAVGSTVKVSCAGERFWVTVSTMDGPLLTGIIDNDLILSEFHDLYYKDKITFSMDNVISIYDGPRG